jgi:1-acyl-sn-glycerol-3-phosphate acyltransferase
MIMQSEECMNPFPGDSYDTPENSQRFFTDRLFWGHRLSFYIRNFYVFYKTGCCAKRGLLDGERQIYYSLKNIKIVEGCGGHLHLRGLNNLSVVEGPVVLIGNHMSLLETAIFHAFLRARRDFTFVIKESLLNVPFFGDIMRATKAIAVGRENPRDDFKAVMKEGKELLKSGKSIIIFPQSTRSENFDPEKFNTIGVKLAKSAGVPIIPFALKTNFLGNGKYLRDLGPIRRNEEIYFEFAPPINVKTSGKEEHAAIIEFIQEKLEAWNHSPKS